MVREGLAWAFVRYSADYVGQEAKAKRGGSVCLNSFPGFLSGASAGVRPPREAAAG